MADIWRVTNWRLPTAMGQVYESLLGALTGGEFGGAVRSYFTFVDRSKDGSVNEVELRGPSMPLPFPTDPRAQQQQGQNPNAQTTTRPGVIY